MTRYAHVFRLFTAPFIAAALMLFLLPIRCFAVTQEELENIEAQREVLETRRDNIEKKVSDLSASHASALEQKAALDERNQITLKQIKESLDELPFMVQCHRAFIVNLNFVMSMTNRSSGFQLHLFGTEKQIPVSRSFTPLVKEKLQPASHS